MSRLRGLRFAISSLLPLAPPRNRRRWPPATSTRAPGRDPPPAGVGPSRRSLRSQPRSHDPPVWKQSERVHPWRSGLQRTQTIAHSSGPSNRPTRVGVCAIWWQSRPRTAKGGAVPCRQKQSRLSLQIAERRARTALAPPRASASHCAGSVRTPPRCALFRAGAVVRLASRQLLPHVFLIHAAPSPMTTRARPSGGPGRFPPRSRAPIPADPHTLDKTALPHTMPMWYGASHQPARLPTVMTAIDILRQDARTRQGHASSTIGLTFIPDLHFRYGAGTQQRQRLCCPHTVGIAEVCLLCKPINCQHTKTKDNI